jgi:hypothetical protein
MILTQARIAYLHFHKRGQLFIGTHDETLFRRGAVIRVYDYAGNVIATHEHKDDFKEP